MAEVKAVSPDFYSIVVVGRMNPAIHHPTWYHYLKLLDDNERDFALAAPTLVSTQQLNQFVAPAFTIICMPDRWEIQTAKPEFIDRILLVASKVFQTLDHTPINAYGFNFHAHRNTSVANTGEVLSEALIGLQLGLEGETGGLTGEVSLTVTGVKGKTTIALSQSPLGPSFLWIRFNSHYDIDIKGGPHFDLEPLLRNSFKPDYTRFDHRVQTIVESLPKLEVRDGSRH